MSSRALLSNRRFLLLLALLALSAGTAACKEKPATGPDYDLCETSPEDC